MPVPQGLCSFPGVNSVISASYTLSHGITPGVCTLECAPQANTIGAGGTMLWTYGAVSFAFTGCKVDQGSLRVNTSGQVVSLAIFDRRWKWAFGSLSGTYNQREADGTINADREKTPQQLASLALNAMGEVGYDVSQMPNDQRPVVAWDRDNPAQSLADLAEGLGCRVVLTIGGTVLIARTGVGATLSTSLPMTEAGVTINPPERPDSLLVVCAPTRIQYDFPIFPVGRDIDGGIRSIFSLSYKPAAGWGGESFYFANVEEDGRELAKKTVWRWYQIALAATDWTTHFADPYALTGGSYPPLELPGFGRVSKIRQIELLNEQVDEFTDEEGNIKPLPAAVYGEFWNDIIPIGNTTRQNGDDPQVYYQKPFRIDASNQMVIFDEQVYGFSPDFENQLPILFLRTSCYVRDRYTFTLSRYERGLVYPGGSWGTGPRVLRHDEIEYKVRTNYQDDGRVTGVTTNEAQVISEADYALAATDLEYQTTSPVEVEYAGLVPISPDGAIQQVTWSVGLGGAKTRAGRNNEFNPAVPPYRERRLYEQIRGGQMKRLKNIVAFLPPPKMTPGGGTQFGWVE